MAEKGRISKALHDVAHGVVGNIIFYVFTPVVGFGVAYISYVASGWAVPVLKGFFASLMFAAIVASWRALHSLPSPADPTTVENIESRAMKWLHNLRLTVKNDPNPETYFRFAVTTDGGVVLYLGRPRDHLSGYLFIWANMKATPEEVSIVASLSEEEKLEGMLAVQLEFSRARIGYSGLDSVTGFSIHKRIPISESLTEDTLINTIWEIEAVMNSAKVLNMMTTQRHRLSSNEARLVTR